ncbi:hypothetical protein SAMN05444337_0191 [Flavobacterium haoranii]|uniref:Uncharacterized protein n=2 Tax=Flavobacterium haoranii TaxID=683124 RepID=A0A1M6BSW6_9FLAO|nr:hypothetical protein SAMN05444337_0191 [Flavobacterium haoranii]
MLRNFATLKLREMRKIKLIWDFRGAAASKTAEHHEIHLKEFLIKENYPLQITGFTEINDMYAIAYVVVEEKDLLTFRDALKPHRGEVYQ